MGRKLVTWLLVDDGRALLCTRCGRASWSQGDRVYLYCRFCGYHRPCGWGVSMSDGTVDEQVARLRSAWRYSSAEARRVWVPEVLGELFGPRQGEGPIDVSSLVASRSGEPVVALRWGPQAGQLSPEEARAHALMILEAAAAADADAFLVSFLQHVVGVDETTAGQLLVEFRQWRQRRAEQPEDPGGPTG